MSSYQFESFQNFFLGLPNPSVSIVEKKPVLPPMSRSSSRCSSTHEPSPLSSYITLLDSEDAEDTPSPSSSETTSPFQHAYTVRSDPPLFSDAEESIIRMRATWKSARNTDAEGICAQASISDFNADTPEVLYSTNQASTTTGSPGLPLVPSQTPPSAVPNEPYWVRYLYKAAKIHNCYNPATRQLLQDLAVQLVLGDEKIGRPAWTENDFYVLVQQIFWVASREGTFDGERDTISHFTGMLMYIFHEYVSPSSGWLLRDALKRYANTLFQSCWNAMDNPWSLRNPLPAQIPVSDRETYIVCGLNLANFIGYLYNLQFIRSETLTTCYYTLLDQLSSVEHVIALRNMLVSSQVSFAEPQLGNNLKNEFKAALLRMFSVFGSSHSLREGCRIEDLGVGTWEELIQGVYDAIDRKPHCQ
ncbi:hypothetical protein D9758_007036 [Tetrapyrgos nigripes]|uniref:Uncharacterized protein n=1 Tax=Tetrapyrgos nigripes TaxID=182062 RepID=A0A8H5GDF2_9AGAR|nr:hypothetical protein D9758_007036 [Tetrapyrgos nigripes]